MVVAPKDMGSSEHGYWDDGFSADDFEAEWNSFLVHQIGAHMHVLPFQDCKMSKVPACPTCSVLFDFCSTSGSWNRLWDWACGAVAGQATSAYWKGI